MLNVKVSSNSFTYIQYRDKREFRSSGLFCAQARGIQFYDVPLDEVKEFRFHCDLEPSNARDTNSIWLKCSPTCILGHLAREALHT